MRIRRNLFATVLLAAAAWADSFTVKPYLQLGDRPKLSTKEALTLAWQTPDLDHVWSVQLRNAGQTEWRSAEDIKFHPIAVRTIAPFRAYTAELTNLEPGGAFSYRVLEDGKEVFASTGQARRAENQFYKFVVFGDCAAGTPQQLLVARQAYAAKPDFVFIPGDIVYSRGRISEYATKYWPAYNADAPSESGVPFVRSTLFIAAPGNHDIATTDVTGNPDGLAYFYNWRQPLNGPKLPMENPSTPVLKGDAADKAAFLKAAGPAYPQAANFSFDYGNAHWTVLDSNKNVDWSQPELRKWLEKDLESASKATWRFVAYHHPGFNSSKTHFGDQWMRLLAPVFEKYKVDIVWSGHVHNYQRSFPLRYAPGEVGTTTDISWFIFDKKFDGIKETKAASPIYIVSGAGGAGLYNSELTAKPEEWQPFTTRYVADTHSFTVVDVKDKQLSIRQISAKGDEIDRFVLTK